jgi:hypothetical protein
MSRCVVEQTVYDAYIDGPVAVLITADPQMCIDFPDDAHLLLSRVEYDALVSPFAVDVQGAAAIASATLALWACAFAVRVIYRAIVNSGKEEEA